MINIAIVETTISQKRIDDFNKEIEIGWKAMENGDVLDGQSAMEELKKKYA